MNTILVVILSGCVWSFVLIYGLKAQTRAEKIKSNPIQNISNVYEEIPVVLFAAPEEVVKRLREEFTPTPEKSVRLESDEQDCIRFIRKHYPYNSNLLIRDLYLKKYESELQYIKENCQPCKSILAYYLNLEALPQISKTFIAIRRESIYSATPEILGTISLSKQVLMNFTDGRSLLKILAAESMTNATLNVPKLKQTPTQVVTKGENNSIIYSHGSIEPSTPDQSMYDYLLSYVSNNKRLFNVPELIHAVLLRKMDGAIDGITGLEYYQQKLIQREVLLYEAPEEVVSRFREEYTPTPQKTPVLEQAIADCPAADSIIVRLKDARLVPKSLLDTAPNECEMVQSYFKIFYEYQLIQKVFMITADVAEGGIPAVLGAWSSGNSRRKPYTFLPTAPSPTINSGSLDQVELQQFKTKVIYTDNGTSHFDRASIINAQEDTMQEYFRSVLRYKRYGKVYKANLLTYVPGFYKPIRIADVVEITK